MMPRPFKDIGHGQTCNNCRQLKIRCEVPQNSQECRRCQKRKKNCDVSLFSKISVPATSIGSTISEAGHDGLSVTSFSTAEQSIAETGCPDSGERLQAVQPGISRTESTARYSLETAQHSHATQPARSLDTKKHKRNRKALPKPKFYCQDKGCGKSYARAEHLRRHQLNHTRKQTYHCDFTGCSRSFVRNDLYLSHRRRHTAKALRLQKSGNYMASSASTEASYSSITPQAGFSSEPDIQHSRSSYAMSPTKTKRAICSEMHSLDTVSASDVPNSGAENTVGCETSYPYSVFGGESYIKSPFSMEDDIMAWLFKEPATGLPVNYSDSFQNYASFVTNEVAFGSPYNTVIP